MCKENYLMIKNKLKSIILGLLKMIEYFIFLDLIDNHSFAIVICFRYIWLIKFKNLNPYHIFYFILHTISF